MVVHLREVEHPDLAYAACGPGARGACTGSWGIVTGPMIVCALVIVLPVITVCALSVVAVSWVYDRVSGVSDRARTYPVGSPERRALEGER